MKNYLVITLGTREIQLVRDALLPNGFEHSTEVSNNRTLSWVKPVEQPHLRVSARYNREFPDVYTLSPRTDGQTILKNWPLFRPIIDWPLIRPALTYLKDKEVRLDVIMLVFTDQEEAFQSGLVKKRENVDNDTSHFAEIIERLIREDQYFDTAEVDHFGRYNAVTDIGVQYDEFARIKEDLLYSDDVRAVYLFPQGGIDQINQALTLRLIETFRDKVIQLQAAEGQGVQELTFPRRFINSLQKEPVKKHLNDYDFAYIDKTLYSDKTVTHLAQYAAKRLSLQHNQVKNHTDILLKDDRLASLHDEFKRDINTEQQKLIDLYLSAKISTHQQSWLEFLHKLYTINENLFRIEAEKLVGRTANYYDRDLGPYDSNQPWIDKLNRTDSQIIPYFTQKGVRLNNPNRWACQALTEITHQNDGLLPLYQRIGEKFEELTKLRNAVAHRLGTTSRLEIDKALGQAYQLNDLFSDLDQIFNIAGFGIYDTIRDEIRGIL